MLIILSGVSGVGKNTVANLLMKMDDNIVTIPSYTTREKRDKEENGKEYFFVSEKEFKKLIDNNELYEHSYHYGDYYGIPKSILDSKLKDHIVVKDIDVNGTKKIKEIFKNKKKNFEFETKEDLNISNLEKSKYNIISIFLKIDKSEMEKRLINRGDRLSKEKFELRMKRFDYEISKKDSYDIVITNEDSEVTAKKIYEIIQKELNKEMI